MKDYTGRNFGFLHVVERAADYVCPGNGKRYVRYKCQCVCGKEVIVNASNLRNHSTKACGCQKPHRFQDLSGQYFGQLKVICRVDDYVNPSGRKLVRYKCQCKCGNEILALANTLRNHDVESCGCMIRSRGEEFVRDWLGEHHIAYDLHKSFPDCLSDKGYRLSFDFWIPDYQALIECNGIQHYKSIDFFGGDERLLDQQRHDALKAEYAKSKGYSYLVLNCSNSRNLNTDKFSEYLNKLFNISD